LRIGKNSLLLCFALLLVVKQVFASWLLIPMDASQKAHCKAYGFVYRSLETEMPDIYWLLNFRGGSFLIPETQTAKSQLGQYGISFNEIGDAEKAKIFSEIQEENMDAVSLEKAPKIAIYLESKKFQDVVADVLKYAEIPFDTIYDDQILDGGLDKYDWLHIHHKDFTGQNHKLPAAAAMLLRGSGNPVERWKKKQKVAQTIKSFVIKGGFLFAMCSAAETFDISLAVEGVDIVPPIIDGTVTDSDFQNKVDYSKGLAFENYQILIAGREYSDIDVSGANSRTSFELFEFSASVDSIPCLLNQNHEKIIPGFSGETSSFRKSLIKRSVTILAENSDGVSVRYLSGYCGKGVFAYYGGHSPKRGANSYVEYAPAYRLILNNVLFPSAKIKKRKT
jgi:hypothetical protein